MKRIAALRGRAKMRSPLFAAASVLALAIAPGANRAIADPIFYDNFSGTTLNPAWSILPGQGSYSVNNGLTYDNQGPLSSPAGWDTTSLGLALPFTGTNWEINIEATYSLDWCTSGNYTGPANPNTSCSSGAQRPQAIVAFDPVTAGNLSALAGSNYADFDRGTDAWYGDNHLTASYGSTVSANLLNPAEATINDNIAGGTYWLQIIRSGGTLTMNYSYDGVNYLTALSTPLAEPSSTYNELILTGTTYLTVDSSTDYSYVDIDSTPEPSTFVPISICVLGAGMGWLRRKTR